ncbi:hypothetical protein [Cellulomonas iranensis]|uniref:hypothetical protein n=1 Tax=Cellulomonas iranensis TaxID=76862 RepID=UPI0013D6607A|nr:hypothetical protein [Cellulomonas iranensis]
MTVIDDAVAQDVRTYAAQVRAALADLGADQVDDLTDGLEANLADALADERRRHGGGSLVDEFGPPAAYADELRTAAGLAPTAPSEPRGLRSALGAPGRAAAQRARHVLGRLRATRWFPPVEDLLVALRPAWWVLRGWALAHLLLQMTGSEAGSFWLPSTFAGWVLLALAVAASAQWGRGRWRTGPRWHRALLALSTFLALAALVLLLTLPDQQRWQQQMLDDAWGSSATAVDPLDGVVVEGEYAHNLFVYDADGQPVDGAQIVDQRGRPVFVDSGPDGGPGEQTDWPDGADEPVHHVGAAGPGGQTRWNVYPLRSMPASGWRYDGDTGREVVVAPELARAPAWPFANAGGVRLWGAPDASDEQAAPAPAPSGAPDVDAATPGGAPEAQAPPADPADPAADAADGDAAPPAAP